MNYSTIDPKLISAVRAALADGWPPKEVRDTFDVPDGWLRKLPEYVSFGQSKAASHRQWCRRVIQDAWKRGIDLRELL